MYNKPKTHFNMEYFFSQCGIICTTIWVGKWVLPCPLRHFKLFINIKYFPQACSSAKTQGVSLLWQTWVTKYKEVLMDQSNHLLQFGLSFIAPVLLYMLLSQHNVKLRKLTIVHCNWVVSINFNNLLLCLKLPSQLVLISKYVQTEQYNSPWCHKEEGKDQPNQNHKDFLDPSDILTRGKRRKRQI